MDTAFVQALQQVFLDPAVWAIVCLAACYGVFLGATPGLTATMGVALFVPMSYWAGPDPGVGGDRHDGGVRDLRR